jgi:hypothetical protein
LSGTRVGIFEEFQNLGGIRIFYNRLGSLPLGPQAPPLDDPLWFIRDLMYFVLATPAIYLFLKWTKGFGVLGICVLFLVIPGSIPEGFVFFVLGAFLQYSEKNIIASFYPTRSWFYCMTILLLIGTCLLHDVSDYWYRFIKFFFILNGVITSFCLAVTLLRRNPELPHPFLARSSFFIFAIHNVLILKQIATPIVYTIIPVDTPVGSIAAYFLVPAFVVGICLGLLFLMEHLLPRTTSLLTGNRKIKSSYA